jgi:hypothetical protein
MEDSSTSLSVLSQEILRKLRLVSVLVVVEGAAAGAVNNNSRAGGPECH